MKKHEGGIGEYIRNETPEQREARVAKIRGPRKHPAVTICRGKMNGLRITVCAAKDGHYVKGSNCTILVAADWAPLEVRDAIHKMLMKAKSNGGLHAHKGRESVLVV